MKQSIKLFCYFLIFCKVYNAYASTDKTSASRTLSNTRIGLGIAGEYASIDTSLKIRFLSDNFSSTQQQTCKKFQVAPSLELGTTVMDNYYLGFLLSWRHSGASKTTLISPMKWNYYFLHQFKLQSYTDALIKFGYKPAQRTMFYGLVGPSIAKWSHTTQQILTNSSTQVSTLINEFTMTEKTVGLAVGGGIEYLIKNKYTISFEYVFHGHRSKSASRTLSYKDVKGLIPYVRSGTVTKIVQPSYSTFAIRLSYFFSL
ncbi:MAG: hypothetical protein K2W94_04455 [Alphaproteobacteria bacterium]|nr:hypothetical protein [Alphaproteobacteria bacterium]